MKVYAVLESCPGLCLVDDDLVVYGPDPGKICGLYLSRQMAEEAARELMMLREQEWESGDYMLKTEIEVVSWDVCEEEGTTQ